MDWGALLGLSGPGAITVTLLVMGLLSKRLGKWTHTPRYYVGFFIAAVLMGISILARLLNIGRGLEMTDTLNNDPVWILIYVGLPAVALTIGLVATWRYWSWLLAERG